MALALANAGRSHRGVNSSDPARNDRFDSKKQVRNSQRAADMSKMESVGHVLKRLISTFGKSIFLCK